MSSNPIAGTPIHTINLREEEIGLMNPVNVIAPTSSNMNGSSGGGGVKATLQNLK
jgi:hypothetical protein